MAKYKSRMPNQGKGMSQGGRRGGKQTSGMMGMGKGNSMAKKAAMYSDTDSGSMGSNMGKSTGLKISNEMRSDTTKTPTTTNRYPNGLA